LNVDYDVKISELKLCSIQRYDASKLLFSHVFHGNDNFCRFCWFSKYYCI